MRYSGQISPWYPKTAPLALRLPQAVYDESSPMGPTSTGPGLSIPMGSDLDDNFGQASQIPVMGGRPLPSARGPLGVVRRPRGTPSWVKTDEMLAMQGDCACHSGVGAFDLTLKNPLVTGALVLAGLWFITKKTKR